MKSAISLLLVILCLTGCQTAPGKTSNAAVPDVQEFSKEDQKLAAKEFEKIRKDAPVITEKILPACLVMRDQARAIKRTLKD